MRSVAPNWGIITHPVERFLSEGFEGNLDICIGILILLRRSTLGTKQRTVDRMPGRASGVFEELL
jgi:hypothetical protein